ncbi:MAG: cardiolipin synthase [Christensenellales bacterium]|nr:cardiolipin synthase [Christensenellales bacterium]
MSKIRQKIEKARLPERGKRGFLTILFGRSSLIALLLVAQAVLLIGLFARWQFAYYAYGGVYALSAFMALYLINQPMNPSTRQTWLILILLAPILGSLLYFFVSMDIGHRLLRKRLEDIAYETKPFLSRRDELYRTMQQNEPELASLARYTYSHGGFPAYANTHVDYYPSGESKFTALLEDLARAQSFIFMEYFIIDEGFMWDRILEILQRKVRQGVEVRVMYDGTCALFRLPYHYPDTLNALGIQCKQFSPIRPLVSTHYNNRDHRKIVVVDGHTAYIGGVNLADEYINRKRLFGHWKDTAIRLQGEAVRSFTLMFLQMWHVSERAVDYKRYLDAPLPEFPPSEGYVIPYGDSPFDDERVGESVYLDIINRARDYVHIMTPYLIIDGEMSTALRYAAKRGVDVRLILPHIPDKKSAFALAYTHYKELIRAGVRIYEYIPGFVHAKVFVSDDCKAVVGTINLDYRSLYLHFECAAYLYKTTIIPEIEADFQDTQARCRLVTETDVKNEKLYRRALGFLLKLFAPLM